MANYSELQSLFSINFGLSVPNTVLIRLINYLYIHSIRMGTYNDIFKHNMAHRSMHATFFFAFFNICDKPNDKIEQI